MTKLLEIVSKATWRIFQDIINHPFNQELANGMLSMERFCYYLEQDSIFVKDCFNIFTGSVASINCGRRRSLKL